MRWGSEIQHGVVYFPLLCSNRHLCQCILSTELQAELRNQRQDFEDLTRKYELLEEDYVVSKAQNSLEKEQLDG